MPKTSEYVRLYSKKKLNLEGDVIKVDNHLNFKQGDYPGSPGWVPYNHKGNDKGRQKRLLELHNVKRTQLAISGFEDKKGYLKPRNVGFLDSGKGKKRIYPLVPSEKNMAANSDKAQIRHLIYRNCKVINVFLLNH